MPFCGGDFMAEIPGESCYGVLDDRGALVWVFVINNIGGRVCFVKIACNLRLFNIFLRTIIYK